MNSKMAQIVPEKRPLEWLLTPQPGRYNIVQSPQFAPLMEHLTLMRQMQWMTAEPLKSLASDVMNMKNLSPHAKKALHAILAFFFVADGIVNVGIADCFNEIECLEAKFCHIEQMRAECIHQETYGLLFNALISDPIESQAAIQSITSDKAISDRCALMKKLLDGTNPLEEAIGGLIMAEGVLFTTAFLVIRTISQYGLSSLESANQLISKDEKAHAELGLILYSTLQTKMTDEKAHQMAQQAIDSEMALFTSYAPEGIPELGIGSDMIRKHVHQIANTYLQRMGHGAPFKNGEISPLSVEMTMASKANFFETVATEYTNPNNPVDTFDIVEFED
jgi:ribonucleotide reductase beta subunit family protein with ferritin-like domain